MSALDWRKQMKLAPRLVHESDGLVLVQLGEHSVLFPSEADARFFAAAYTDVPNLSGQVETLRGMVDENALGKALERVAALEAALDASRQEVAVLHVQNAVLAEKAAKAAMRARLLAGILKSKP